MSAVNRLSEEDILFDDGEILAIYPQLDKGLKSSLFAQIPLNDREDRWTLMILEAHQECADKIYADSNNKITWDLITNREELIRPIIYNLLGNAISALPVKSDAMTRDAKYYAQKYANFLQNFTPLLSGDVQAKKVSTYVHMKY